MLCDERGRGGDGRWVPGTAAGPGNSSVPLGEPVEAVEGVGPGTLTCSHSAAQAVQDRWLAILTGHFRGFHLTGSAPILMAVYLHSLATGHSKMKGDV